MRTPFIAACFCAAASVGYTQNAGPSFEVASIKPNRSGTTIADAGRVSGDRFTAMNATVIQLLRSAYGVQEFQIAGPPGWTGIDRFDITANVPSGSKPDAWPEMLRGLLVERFRLKVHREQRETDVYALVVVKDRLTLTPVDASRCAPPNGSCGFSATPTEIVARGQSMEQLATRLSRSIGQTVVDRTGLSGVYDFKLEWTQDDQFRAPGATASPAIFTALSEQLGLRLQSQRAPVEMLVVDGVERPTPD
jgi:uncharacterized protein (TIGR03435 family)